MILNLDISLKQKQTRMFNLLGLSRFAEFLFYGASRSGKTFLIIFWMIVQCVVYEANCLVLRNLFTALQGGMLNQTLPAVLKAIARLNGRRSIDDVVMKNGRKFCEFNGKLNTLTFFNGAYIQFASLRGSKDTSTTYDKILSTEWGHIFVDEVSEIDEQAIDILRSRLAQKLPAGVRNKLIYALNPTTKLHWTFLRFFKKQSRDGEPLAEKITKKFCTVHFKLEDNKGNISEDYGDTLDNMSRLQQMRFKDGEYADESEGEIFKWITWAECPAPAEFKACLIYTDPSAKDQKNNDYKASVLLGLARNKIWLISARAVQGTSAEMIRGMHELFLLSPVTPRVYMEKRQVPLDFETTFNDYCNDNGWICPLTWDTRNHGDKFTNIESTLEPLFTKKAFIFCNSMKDSGVSEISVDQFITFSRKSQRDRKDDIPDACAKGTSVLMRLKPMENIRGDVTRLVRPTGNRKTM